MVLCAYIVMSDEEKLKSSSYITMVQKLEVLSFLNT